MTLSYDQFKDLLPGPEKKAGKGVLKRCPAHDDHDPSLWITPSDNPDFTVSFTCQAQKCDRGDILKAMKLTWNDVRTNARKTKAELIKTQKDIADHIAHETPKVRNDFTNLAQHLHNNLLTCDMAKKYLASRLIDDKDIEKWNLGYSLEKNAIAIPHLSKDGTVPAIKYRLLLPSKEEPKYISEGGSTLSEFYNPDALTEEKLFLAEGEFDCILLNKFGFKAIALPTGAASFGPTHVPLFSKVSEFYLLLDADQGGVKGMEKIQSMLGDKAIPIKLPDGMDITDYFKAGYKPEELSTLIKSTKRTHERKLRLSRGELLNVLELDGFLRSYMDYAHRFTSSPRELHLAVGLAMISAAMTNKVHTYVWGRRLYPNIWIVEVADSGICRKTTAMSIGIEILKDVNSNLIFPNELTREKFWEYLSGQPYGLMPIWEFSSMTENLDKEYQVGLKADLTSIFDASNMKRQTKSETQEIKDCALTILSATTISWMQLKKDDFKGGFFARFLYMPARFTMDDWKGLVTHRDAVARQELVEWLKVINEIEGEIDLSGVRNKINDWLKVHDEKVFLKEPNADLDGFYSRAGTLVIKLAILFEISHSTGFIISEQSADNAIALVEYLERSLETVIQGKMFENKVTKDVDKLVEYLGRKGGKLDRMTIAKNMHLTKKQLDEVVTTGEDMGMIKLTMVRNKGADKPTQIIELVKK